MKKILFFINTLNAGGAEKALVEIVNNLDREEFQITLQTLMDSGVYEEMLKENICHKSILKKKNGSLNRIYSVLLTRILPSKLVYNLFVKGDYDCEIAFLEGFPTKVIAASTNKTSRKIGWLHTDLLQYPDSQKVFSKGFSEQKAYEKLDRVICVSESVRRSLIKKYAIEKGNTAVLYNVVDDEAVRSRGNQEISKDISHPLIVSAGRLTEQKAFDRLLRIHKRLMDEGIRHTLWILGEGDKRQDLEEYIQQNKLTNVELLGFQKNPYRYMAKADLFVSSSIAEGFSTVITESVILGVPVISTNTAGAYEPPEAPRCSVVVEDEEQLYEAVKKVLSDREELDRLKADAKSKQPFFQKQNFVNKIQDELTR